MTVLGYQNIFSFLIVLPAIVISIVLHELAHGYVALWNGDATAKANGRLTLNPLAHFDPVGFVMLILVRFGYAKPVPINPSNFRNRKRGLITVSLAGIVLNLLLAFFATPFYLLCARSNSEVGYYFGLFFRWLMIINMNLALFNILPIYPLDGYRVVESLTRATNGFNKFMRNYGQYVLILLIGMSAIAEAFNMPWYFDPIGAYIGIVGGYARSGFVSFWGLVIR